MSAEINCALLLAAGSGARMGDVVADKILAPINGHPVFSYSLRAFAECSLIQCICIVYRDEAQKERLAQTLDETIQPEVIWVQGGKERQDSVLNGLEALPVNASHTLIHDCARPLLSVELIQKLIASTRRDGAACLAHPVTDTVKRIPLAGELKSTSLEDLDRDRLWAMETPQAFRHADILKAYQHVKREGLHITDDCAAAASIGVKTTLIHNSAPNPKITTAADLDYISWLLEKS
jgi:2-C-methyl-D-erythritol 4-phosphate cytidylyltransferase